MLLCSDTMNARPENLAARTLIAWLLVAAGVAGAADEAGAEDTEDRNVFDGAPSTVADAFEACLREQLALAEADVTVGEIRMLCEHSLIAVPNDTVAVGPVDGLTPVDERAAKEDLAMDRDFILTAYEPTYILGTYVGSPNQVPFQEELGSPRPLNNEEVKFQISIKAPVWREPFGWGSDLYFGFTSTSWWQLGNQDISNPFRETNYEPELFLRNLKARRVFGLKFTGWDAGFTHESNGRAGDLSRSWNRIIGRTVLDLNDVAVLLRAWYRIPESGSSDDNPNIEDYTGYGDLRAVWTPSRNTYTLKLQPASEGTAVELTWSRPLSRTWRVYAQYWNGYGESLIDYDYRIQRIGIGLALNDYLER